MSRKIHLNVIHVDRNLQKLAVWKIILASIPERSRSNVLIVVRNFLTSGVSKDISAYFGVARETISIHYCEKTYHCKDNLVMHLVLITKIVWQYIYFACAPQEAYECMVYVNAFSLRTYSYQDSCHPYWREIGHTKAVFVDWTVFATQSTSSTVDISERISNFIPHVIMDKITYPCCD